jgi:uncharacterized protein with ACT and thioredoxin-like domain
MSASYIIDHCGENGTFYIGFEDIRDAELYVDMIESSGFVDKSHITTTCRILPKGVFADLIPQFSDKTTNILDIHEEIIRRTEDAYTYYCIQVSLL